MKKERILITVKTYPVLSSTYVELVCTAGLREDGSWVRIYPSPFRFLEGSAQYAKYDWVDLLLQKNPKDPRPESYRPANIDDIQLVGKIDTANDWYKRRQLVLGKGQVYTNLAELIAKTRTNELSLAVFKPTRVLDFIAASCQRDWDISRQSAAEALLSQGSLFHDTDFSNFRLVRKLPYKFSYRFQDDSGKESTLMIEDWEVGQLYWNCLKAAKGDEAKALEKVRAMYLDHFVNNCDLHFFLGTTHEGHMRKFTNPFVIVGAFYPPIIRQQDLF